VLGAPLSLSQMGRRHRWSPGRAGAANLVGVLPLGVGMGLLVWAVSSHTRAAPHGWEIGPTPDYLLTSGPYRFTRNPIYVGEAAIWAGWAVLFGSLPVTTGLAVLAGLQAGIVHLEERMLHKRWGVRYDHYRRQVPRWIGLPAVAACPQPPSDDTQ
jgi:protein-S-isoprenylcysteine O-methyltransferase Ste14